LARTAIGEALAKGLVSEHVAALAGAVLRFSDGRGTVVWAGQSAIGTAMGGKSARTARCRIREAEAAGLLWTEHRPSRFDPATGQWRGQSNLSYVVLPAAVEELMPRRKGKGHPTPRAPQNRAEPRTERPPVVDHVRAMAAARDVARADELEPPLRDVGPVGQEMADKARLLTERVKARQQSPP